MSLFFFLSVFILVLVLVLGCELDADCGMFVAENAYFVTDADKKTVSLANLK